MADPIPLKNNRNQRGFSLHRLDALPERPAREEVIQGLLAVGEIGAIVAPAGEGKSTVAQLLLTCIAEGRPFLGRNVLQGPAIYIAAERGQEAARRLLAIRRKAKAPLYVAMARPDLSNQDEVTDLANRVRQVCEHERSCPGIIVIDTLARCMPGLDENSARDMGRVVEGLTRLVEQVPSAAVLFVHHAGKGGDGEMRGSTALIGAVDVELQVKNAKGKIKRLVVTKANAVAEGQALPFRLVPIEYRDTQNADPEIVISAEIAEDEEGPIIEAHNAEPSRSEKVLSLIAELAVDRLANRQACLQTARERKLIEGKSADSTAEQFRKVLVELRDADLITFENKTITLGSGATPNRPNAPL
ncbi:AAA family ATPase [Bradyrhizobium australafricanum]|uniref:AAA family ATPase n=1 Tax=Bradyrhizobium australafricanum TaxID=2821406 RepID=UPI001CE2B87C|nr:AAA family ATPase [Bradyrhizobium australafricanum]MCA6099199.1 AAA family ATPase [Bradyrhizobium australafricanum]